MYREADIDGRQYYDALSNFMRIIVREISNYDVRNRDEDRILHTPLFILRSSTAGKVWAGFTIQRLNIKFCSARLYYLVLNYESIDWMLSPQSQHG